MLHIRWKCRFQLKNAAKSMENGQNMLQTVANTVENTMENERFELKTVAHTVEMAVSSSKMLQIAWKMVRTGNPKKIPQTKKKIPKQFPTLFPCFSHGFPMLFGSTQFSPCQGPASSAWAGVSLACAPALRWPPSSRDFETDFFLGLHGGVERIFGEISDGYLNGIESDFW